MNTRKIKVGVVGPGTIGHRVITYVNRQPDMEIAAVSKASTHDYYETTKHVLALGIPIYPAPKKAGDEKAAVKEFRDYFTELRNKQSLKNIEATPDDMVPGPIADMLDVCDVIVDCSGGRIGIKTIAEMNKERYYVPYNTSNPPKKIKVIFQGGESKDMGKLSFNTSVNYHRAVDVGRSDEPYIRQVSCNTTALSRLLYLIRTNYIINRLYAVIVQRSSDPGQMTRFVLNDVHMGDKMPSHHGPDVECVFDCVDDDFADSVNLLKSKITDDDIREKISTPTILTGAIKVTTDQMHAQDLTLTFPVSLPFPKDNYPENEEEFHKILEASIIRNRFKFIDHPLDTSCEREAARRVERMHGQQCNCGDIFEVVMGMYTFQPEKRITPFGNEWVHLKMHIGVHQEAIVIPEIIDGIRALSYDVLKKSKEESIKTTDKSLGLRD
ncbi:MAG: hypothetical protein A7315_05420 [Candidatus Altiarchaeales archaeon WOR_SM1_79]|nr:MAG: hypothetical protein A7315_05420 [Candidatus Altiarchaeales archaeon WOR_SM1_79]